MYTVFEMLQYCLWMLFSELERQRVLEEEKAQNELRQRKKQEKQRRKEEHKKLEEEKEKTTWKWPAQQWWLARLCMFTEACTCNIISHCVFYKFVFCHKHNCYQHYDLFKYFLKEVTT